MSEGSPRQAEPRPATNSQQSQIARKGSGELGVHLSHLKRRLELLREDKVLTERSREGLRDYYRHECDKAQLELNVLNKMEQVGAKEKHLESASKKVEFAQSEAGRKQARRIWQRRGAGMALSGGSTDTYRLAQFPDNPEAHELKIARQQRAEANRLLTAARNDLVETSSALEKSRLEDTKWNAFKAEAERWELRQRWESVTPEELQPAIRAIRKAFDDRCWEFEQCTMKLCYAALHPTTAAGTDSSEPQDLEVYKRFLIQFLGEPVRSSFVGPERSTAFIFKTYIDTYEKGLKAVLRSAFQEVFEIAKNQTLILNTHPAEWARTLMTLLVSAEKFSARTWIKRSCDKEDLAHSSVFHSEDVLGGTWRAPRFIHMQPSGNTPYDEATAWAREDMAETEHLLEGRAQNLVTFLLIELERTAGSAHIEFAKGNGRSSQAPVASSTTYSSIVMAGSGLRGTPASETWHSLRERFRALAQEELDGAPNNANDRWLRAYGDYQPSDITSGQWQLSEGLNEGFKERFELEATRAGVSLESSLPGEPRDLWLHRVFMDLLENKSKLLMGADKEGGIIARICEASAIYCARLEKRALTEGKSSLASAKVNGIDAIPEVALHGHAPHGSSVDDDSQLNREAAIKKVRNPQSYTVLTISEAALYFEVESRTIHRWISDRKLIQGVRRGSVKIESIVKYEKKRSRKRKYQ